MNTTLSQSQPGILFELSGKRMLDVVLCLLALPVLALFTLLIAIMLSFVSPGPVFFRQERVGYRGRRFRIYKFRTMKVAADTGVHQQHFSQLIHTNAPMVKLDAKDSRLIPGGHFLRASGLDELPQLVNVLLGDMSLVGPRPCLPAEYVEYTAEQKQRFLAHPGLTGLWQVSGKNRTTFTEMIRLDIKYAQTKSLWLDLWIMFMTIPALIQQLGDAQRIKRQAMKNDRVTEMPFPMDQNACPGRDHETADRR